MTRRLYRSQTSKMIAGVCGGIAEHLDLDPTLIRLLAVFGFFASAGSAALAYVICWMVIPEQEFDAETGEGPDPVTRMQSESVAGWHSFLPGLILVGIGAIMLVREYWMWFDFGDFWPVALILIGIGVIVFASSGNKKGRQSSGDEPVNGQQGGLS